MQLIFTGSEYFNADIFSSFDIEEEDGFCYLKGHQKDGEHLDLFGCGDKKTTKTIFHKMALELSNNEPIVDIPNIKERIEA